MQTPLTFDLSNPQFWVAVVQIVLIDIVLSGDNAVVIALAPAATSPSASAGWGSSGVLAARSPCASR
jgi:hypothetical protein